MSATSETLTAPERVAETTGAEASTAQEPAILIEGLSQSYGRMQVLHDVSFRVEHGEIFGFIGPNGAGKTTTIRTMATLLEPTAGRVEICGVDVVLEPERVRRLIGYMPDHAGVYERITVREYLEFFAHAHGITDTTVTDAVIELTDLQELSPRLVVSLSKGMRQRLQLARVLLHDPQVLILDEPASDLDPRARIEIRDLLLELRELGKTIFLSSHILSELSDVCTAVGIIEKGQLLVAGPIGTISEQLAAAATTGYQSTASTAALSTGAQPAAPLPAVTDQIQSTTEAMATAPPRPAHNQAPGEQPEPQLLQQVSPPQFTPGGALVPSSVQHRLKLRAIGDTFRLRPLLDACPPISQVDIGSAGQVTITYVGDARFVAQLVRYLVSHGIDLVAVEPERNELERIFLEVTKGRLQ